MRAGSSARSGVRAHAEHRHDSDGKCIRAVSSQADHHAGGPAQAAHSVLSTRFGRRRWSRLLRARHYRPASARCHLCRPHPQRREACRPTSPGADRVRTRHQPEDSQGARSHGTDHAARPRRRGDRVMKRRNFITLLGGAVAAWPLAARAQQPAKLPTVGFIGSDTPDAYAVLLRAFRVGLKATGFIEGQNVAIEYRWAEGRNDKLSEFAVDLVRRQVAVIVAPTTPSVLAAKAATRTIPIVFFTTGDPASPNLAEAQSGALETAARSRGLQLHVLKASTEQDFDIAFASVAQLGASGLVISSDSFFFSQSAQLARLAIRHAIPTIFGFREFVAAGGLMSYGGSLTESFRWVGVYTGRVLKGETLANL